MQYREDSMGFNMNVGPMWQHHGSRYDTYGSVGDGFTSVGSCYGGGAYNMDPWGYNPASFHGDTVDHVNQNNSFFLQPGSGCYGSFGHSGMGSLMGFGPAGTECPYLSETPPAVCKLFTSRRDKFRVASQKDLMRVRSEMSFMGGGGLNQDRAGDLTASGGISKNPSQCGSDPQAVIPRVESELPVTANMKSYSPAESGTSLSHPAEESKCSFYSVNTLSGWKTNGTSTPTYNMEWEEEQKARTLTTLQDQGLHEKSKKATKEATTMTVTPTVSRATESVENSTAVNVRHSDAPEIPLSNTLSEVVHEPVHTGSTFGDGEKNNPQNAPSSSQTGRTERRQVRRRATARRQHSVPRTRSASTINISIAEFPEAQEMPDTLDDEILQPQQNYKEDECSRSLRSKAAKITTTQLLMESKNEAQLKIDKREAGAHCASEENKNRMHFQTASTNKLEGSVPLQKEDKLGNETSGDSLGRCSAFPPIIIKEVPEEITKHPVTSEGQTESVKANERNANYTKTTSEAMQLVQDKGNRQQCNDGRKTESNPVKTIVFVGKHLSDASQITAEGDSFTYRGVKHETDEVVLHTPCSISYHSNILSGVRDAVCNGHNAAVLSVEAPNASTMFTSLAWSSLTRIVRSLIQRGQSTPDCSVSLTAALGFFHKDKVRDLFDESSSTFETLQVQPSPIYGPRIPQLRYGKIISSTAFDEALNNALRRASSDTILSTTKGVVVALLLAKQTRVIKTDSGESTCDVFLSSLLVASAGSDTHPYESAILRTRNEYCMLFHLVLGGPAYTCFMLNLCMDKEDSKVEGNDNAEIEQLIALHDKMHLTFNYPLRDGSVTRFIRYVEAANKEGLERLKQEENVEKRNKLERHVQEQIRLMNDARKVLSDANSEMLTHCRAPNKDNVQ